LLIGGRLAPFVVGVVPAAVLVSAFGVICEGRVDILLCFSLELRSEHKLAHCPEGDPRVAGAEALRGDIQELVWVVLLLVLKGGCDLPLRAV
jgi:hypothetical protein